MNAVRKLRVGAVVVSTLVACAPQSGSQPPPPPPAPDARTEPASALRAQAGDTVYLIELHVRPERRDQFEDFVQQILWPAFQHAETSTGREVLSHTRMLMPLQENADTSFTYTFILDPVVTGEAYDVLALLRARYGDEEAVRQYQRFTETWKRDFTSRAFVQSTKPGGR